jgi:hypothetical protein
MALAEETGRIHREAQAAAEKLEGVLRERDADRKQLAETQEALQEAMQHLEEISDEAQVPLNIAQDNAGAGAEHGLCGFLCSLLVTVTYVKCLLMPQDTHVSAICYMARLPAELATANHSEESA